MNSTINVWIKSSLLAIILLFSHSSGYGQINSEDSLLILQQVSDLIQNQEYASAQLILEKHLEEFGMNAEFACLMVSNGLQNYYRQENYDFFYLKDAESGPSGKAGKMNPVTRLRYPRRLLEKVIQQYPEKALAYKLMGDYYNIQLRDLSHFQTAQKQNITELEDRCFYYYSHAEQLGFKDRDIYRWLGDYYINRNQPDMAEKYYLKNIRKSPPDAISLFQLAEISFQKKQYTQAYNYSSEALKYLKPEDIYLKYDAQRISAISLRELGEENRFISMINECLQMLPDLQDAYIDLIDYYVAKEDTLIAEETFTAMFMNNPFDRPGYTRLEKYIIQSGHFSFADSLFDRLIVRYENWDEVMANIYWSRGNIAYQRNLKNEATSFWEISKNYMRRYLPENNDMIRQVGEIAQKKP